MMGNMSGMAEDEVAFLKIIEETAVPGLRPDLLVKRNQPRSTLGNRVTVRTSYANRCGADTNSVIQSGGLEEQPLFD